MPTITNAVRSDMARGTDTTGTEGSLRDGRGWRGTSVAIVVVALALGAVPAIATDGDPIERLDETRSELDGAREGLERAGAAVEQAQHRLAEIDERLAVRTTELTRLEEALVEAESAHARTVERLAEATDRVREVGKDLRSLEEDESTHRARLQDRVASAYMRGGASAGTAVTLLLGVSDLHDISMGMRALGAMLDDDRMLVETTRQLKHETAGRRAELARLRAVQQDEEATARDERARIEQLVRRERRILAEIAEERAERTALLDRLEQDEEIQAEIVRRLEERLASLTRELFGSPTAGVVVDWEVLALDGPTPAWAGGIPERGRIWAPAIEQAARQAGIEPRLLAAVVWSESSFRPGAVSHAGAIGLAQLMPGTAAGLGVDPRDPLQNLAGGATYLARQLTTFGSVELALAAYNAGPGAVRTYGSIPPFTETQMYVLTVLDRFEQLLR